MNLFTDKECDYCSQSLISAKNPLFFDGFRDTRTGQLVCWYCKEIHYDQIRKELNGGIIYSEMPEYI